MAKIEILNERCKGCGICISICPEKCLVVGQESNKLGYKYSCVSSADDCDRAEDCIDCAVMCPDDAIEIAE